MMSRLVAIFLSALCVSVSSVAGASENPVKLKSSPTLAVTGISPWKTIQKGIDARQIALERAQPAYTVDLKLFRFDTSAIMARLIYGMEHNLKTADARTLARRAGAIAAINANYYSPDGKPLAYLKTVIGTVNPRVSSAALYSGVFAVKDRRPFIARRNDFMPDHADEATQTGPLLLLGGGAQPLTGLPDRPSRRALVGIDREHKLFIAITDTLLGGLTWSELLELFTAPQWQLQAHDLLALDGGGSAQLYIKKNVKDEEFIAGTAEVPVAIGFFPKTQ
jgi:uncharacterized protein YigE (DUF2233 family)